MSDEERSSRPWQWPAEWFRDEKFWRDVGSRFLAGLLVVFVTWVAAVAFGYLQQPEFVHNLGNVLLIIAVVGMTLSVPLQISHSLQLRKRGDERWKTWAWSVALDIPAIIALGYFALTTWQFTP